MTIRVLNNYTWKQNSKQYDKKEYVQSLNITNDPRLHLFCKKSNANNQEETICVAAHGQPLQS